MKSGKIKIRLAYFDAFVGIHPHEKKRRQPLLFNVDMHYDVSKAAESGNITDALDYAAVHETMRQYVEEQKFELLESLVEELSEILLREYPQIMKLRIEVKKPEALAKERVAMTSYEIVRERE